MAAALQIVPAGARSLGGGVYQLPRRRGTGNRAARRAGAKAAKRGKVSFFSKQWVWYALAIALADAFTLIIFPQGPPKYLSVPAMFLYFYGKMKNQPGACNAAYAIQGAHMLVTFGFSEMMQSAARKAMGR